MAAAKKKTPPPPPPAAKPADLAWATTNGWLNLTAAEEPALQSFASDYRGFISAAKTEREAHDLGLSLATQAGFLSLDEVIAKGRRPKAGAGLWRSIGGKTLVLVRLGRRDVREGMRIIGGHTDSPRLDLKQRPLYEDSEMALLDTHYYGGVRKYQWVTIPLALHGVVVRKDGERVNISIGEGPEDPVFTITDLLPHLGKDQDGKKLTEAITGEGLNVLAGSRPVVGEEKDRYKLGILRLLHEACGITEQDLGTAELELVPAGPARELGFDRSLILGYGQDDRVCSYCALRALLDQPEPPEHTAICMLCDKEEIGSFGSTGMEGQGFENAAAEVVNLMTDGYSELDLRRSLRQSKMLSADVNALHDPNYPEVSSPNENMARLNHGLIISKYVGARGKAGSNDASAEYLGFLRGVFDAAGVTWQTGEIGRVDQGGGGTIAYMLARYEMDVVDCGVGILSMHAPHEVAAKLDVYMAYKGYGAFYRS